MAFGFSVGDIIAGGKLAKDIYENCFTREQAAREFPVYYRGFSEGGIQLTLLPYS